VTDFVGIGAHVPGRALESSRHWRVLRTGPARRRRAR
jgi:hypothetical protein